MTHTPHSTSTSAIPHTPSADAAPSPPSPASNAGPNSSEVYGFVLHLSSVLCCLLFLVWAYAPAAWLHALSITYYPSHWWALALPAYVSLLPLFLFLFYVAYNLHSTLPLTHPGTLLDGHTRYPPPSYHPPPASITPRYSIPDLYDLPLDTVNAYLYGAKRKGALSATR